MNVREIAQTLVELRRLLNLGMIAELSDRAEEYDRLLATFDELASKLPMWVVWRDGLALRVIQPATRKVEREGILAQSPHADHAHTMRHHVEIQTWLCDDCGFSYMSASS